MFEYVPCSITCSITFNMQNFSSFTCRSSVENRTPLRIGSTSHEEAPYATLQLNPAQKAARKHRGLILRPKRLLLLLALLALLRPVP